MMTAESMLRKRPVLQITLAVFFLLCDNGCNKSQKHCSIGVSHDAESCK